MYSLHVLCTLSCVWQVFCIAVNQFFRQQWESQVLSRLFFFLYRRWGQSCLFYYRWTCSPIWQEKSNISKRPTWIRRPRVLRQGKKQADSLHVLWRGKKAFSITISDWLLSHCFFSHFVPNTAAYVGCSKKDHINIYGPWVIQCVTSVLILKSSVSFSSISLTVLLNWDSDVIFSHILDSMCAGSDCLTISGILL